MHSWLFIADKAKVNTKILLNKKWRNYYQLIISYLFHIPVLLVADLEIFDRGGPIDYPMGIYLGHTKIVAN